MLLQILLSLFLFFAISRVYLQLRGGGLQVGGFLFWFGLFAFALVGVLEPDFTTYAANALGIGRGADLVIYASLALMFYLIFRTNVYMEDMRHEITKLVRALALLESEYESKISKKTTGEED